MRANKRNPYKQTRNGIERDGRIGRAQFRLVERENRKRKILMRTPLLSVSLALPGHGSALASIQVAGNLARVRTAKLGELIEGVILIKNTGWHRARIRLLPAAFHSCEAHPASAFNEDWLVVSPSEFEPEPEETVRVRYSCRVPERESLRGSLWSLETIEAPEGAPPLEIREWGHLPDGTEAHPLRQGEARPADREAA